MKDVTLKEFIEIAKDNNQLKDKVLETVNVRSPENSWKNDERRW